MIRTKVVQTKQNKKSNKVSNIDFLVAERVDKYKALSMWQNKQQAFC